MYWRRLTPFTARAPITRVVIAALVPLVAACGGNSQSLTPTGPSGIGSLAATAPAQSAQHAPSGAASFSPSLAAVPPVFTPSNPTCQSLGYGFEAKIDPADPGTTVQAVPGIGSITLIVDSDDHEFDWSATFGIDAVIAKGGPDANVYVYDPPSESTGDTDLHAPINGSTGEPYGISHVSFCYDINLEVTKTATTTYSRDFDWTIAKSVSHSAITLGPGQQFVVTYQVAIVKDGGTDGGWSVSGTIDVTNPHPSAAATGISVIDTISGVGAVPVACPSTTVAPGATMQCSYGPVPLPDGAARTNTATATTATSGIGNGTGSAAVTFGAPSTLVDDCVTISDTMAGGLGTICASQTFPYSHTIAASSMQCGDNLVSNTASLSTDDGAIETAVANVAVAVDCPSSGGCSLSAGYWRTHSRYGPAPYNSTWAAIGEDTPFALSGRSHYGQLHVPAGGNAYNILAFQFIAAQLNMAAGAAAPAGVDVAQIEAFFSTYTPATVGSWKNSNPLAQQALGWAGALDSYNNGELNVNHCST